MVISLCYEDNGQVVVLENLTITGGKSFSLYSAAHTKEKNWLIKPALICVGNILQVQRFYLNIFITYANF